ncbi:MAG: tRNA pseudouridine(55) synthase TruB [Flavobacteriaceae bacterium]|nr:tRNA pseudouridine(55) synthase TruB [Flavobacteriaceae bacterium]MCI5088052.1 tRNA pseudouridine(55) synthase TruB [Flavobacteriaceae bacterium]CAI8182813.1 MAG: tRNA pseudouridine synthase B [SAR116 cluster bacterium]
MSLEQLSLEDFMQGQVLLIDKPLEWSSYQAVNTVKWAIKKKFDIKKIKVGHAGTLDPLASGLLIICTGKFTKKISELQGQQKTYTGTIRLGKTTPSYDLETEFNGSFPTDHINKTLIEQTLPAFRGNILQRPPVFSALKKEGKRLYEYARAGEEVDIPKRAVHIERFEVNDTHFPDLNFEIECSKGTYIRSLAHDFGRALQSGAHLSELRRTKIGDFNVDNAVDAASFKALLGVLDG